MSRVIPVNRIPKTTSGKLQRRLLADAYTNGDYDTALAEIDKLLAAAHEQQSGDLSSTEAKLKSICDELIKDKSVNIKDNLFEMGISSLTLMEIHQQIDDAWPGVVDITDLFDNQSIAEVAAFIDSKSS